MYRKFKHIQYQYMAEYLRHSVLAIKENYTKIMDLNLNEIEEERAWFQCWFSKFELVHPDISIDIRALRILHEESGLNIKEFLVMPEVEYFDDLVIGYYQSYMLYKIAGVRYEKLIIERLKEVYDSVYEADWLDYRFKTDCSIEYNTAIQIKHNKFWEEHGDQFYYAARKYKAFTRFIMITTSGVFEKDVITGKWFIVKDFPIDIKNEVRNG